eukprot:XP_015579540.1 cytochrome P450 CYP72A219 [Ricinus communis]
MEMGLSSSSVAVSIVFVIIITWVWKILNWVWFRPKSLENYLKKQGLGGNPYRFLYGDMKENMASLKKAKSSPIGFSEHIALRVTPLLHQVVNSCGKNSFIWVGPTPRVNIMNPEHIKDVFTKIHEFTRPRMNPQSRLLASGVAFHEGEKWNKHRKIINPAFHQEKLKLMLPQFYQSCKEMIEKWEKLISTKESYEVDVWPYLQNLACDVISRAAFGSNYEEGKMIFDNLKELARLIMQGFLSVYLPGWRFMPTKTNRRIKQIDREIQASLRSIIDKREKAMKAGEATNDDLLGILMESNLREIEENSMGLSIQEVMDECRLFYFAGQETTSVLLVWTMILLSKYPHWQEQARQEVLQVFGGKMPEFDGLNRLKVVTMILHEVLRLYPPVPVLSRSVDEDIRLDDVMLPAGVYVSLPTILIHQDPELWGDDASEFKPERFSGGIAKATKNQISFFPFGWGPRICIGQNFALAEAKMALAIILQHFTFELSPSYTHAPTTVITLRPEHGAQLILGKL